MTNKFLPNYVAAAVQQCIKWSTTENNCLLWNFFI